MINIVSNVEGAGKTLFIVQRNYKIWYEKFRQANDMHVYSNIWLKFPYKPIEDFEHLFKIKNASMILDEWWLMFDSRKSISSFNTILSHYTQQSRKFNVIIWITTQHISQLDLRMRNNCNILYVPEIEDNSMLVNVYNIPKNRYESLIEIPDIRPYFKLYNTREFVKKLPLCKDHPDMKIDEFIELVEKKYGL